MRQSISVLLVLALLLPLAACSAQKPPEQTLSGLQDPSFFRNQDRGCFFIETADSYYYLYNEKVYFSRKDKPEFYILCSKPNCSHSDEECNAYAGTALGYWAGDLYAAVLMGENKRIIRMNLDGSEHETIAPITMPVASTGASGGTYDFTFHNGYLYYYVAAEPNSFFRVELSSGKTERILDELLQDDSGISQMLRFDGDNMYFFRTALSGERVLYQFNSVENTLSRLWIWPENTPEAWMVNHQTVFYYSRERGTFCEYNYSTGKRAESEPQNYYAGAAYYDTDYVYLITWEDADFSNKGLSFYTLDYQFLGQLEIPNGFDFDYATQDYLFFAAEMSNRLTYYLPKSSIGSGELELLPLPDPYSYR